MIPTSSVLIEWIFFFCFFSFMFCAAPFLKLDRTIVLFLILFSSSKNLNHQSLHICCKCNKIYINDVFLANKNYALRIYFYNATLVLRMIEVGYETGIKTCKNDKKNAMRKLNIFFISKRYFSH